MHSENKTPEKLKFTFPGKNGTVITWEPTPEEFISQTEAAMSESSCIMLGWRLFKSLGMDIRDDAPWETIKQFHIPILDLKISGPSKGVVSSFKTQLGLDKPKDWSVVTWAELKEAGADKRPPTKFCKWNTRHDEQECDDSAMKACQIDDEREEACSYKVTPRFIKWCLNNYCSDGVVKFLDQRIKKPNGMIRTADYLQSWIRFDKTYYSNQLYCQHHLSHNLEIDRKLLIKE